MLKHSLTVSECRIKASDIESCWNAEYVSGCAAASATNIERVDGLGFASGNEKIERLTRQGICFSACAYAFLGGVSREIGERGIYGVHQFFSSDRPLGDGTTQVAMTVIASYLDEMGVNRRLLDLASVTSSRRMSSLPIDIARRLLIDNTEPELASWSVDTTNTGELYAYVVQHQPRRDATVSFMIIRNEAGFVGSILYRINQKFRSVRELNDIFLDESHTFSENVSAYDSGKR